MIKIPPALFGITDWSAGADTIEGAGVISFDAGETQMLQKASLAALEQSYCYHHVDETRDLLVGVFGRICHWPDMESDALKAANHAQVVAQNFAPDMGFLRDLAGEFAIVIWDNMTKKLYLVKDHIGTRSLYYVHQKGRVVFATNIQSLLPYCENSERLYAPKVVDFLTANYQGGHDRTMIDEVHTIEMAHYVCFDAGGKQVRKYWDLDDAPKVRFKSKDEYYAQAQRLIIQATTERVPLGQPVGTHVSGGLDSNIITKVLMDHCKAKKFATPIGAAWVKYPEEGAHVWEHQMVTKRAADLFGIETHYLKQSDKIERDFWRQDPAKTALQPEVLTEYFTQENIAEFNCPLFFSGWGGDHVVSLPGRNWRGEYFPMWLRQPISRLRGRRVFKDRIPPFVKGEFMQHLDHKKHVVDTYAKPTRVSQIAMVEMGVIQQRLDSWCVNFQKVDVQYAFPLLDRRLLEFAVGVPWHVYRKDEHKRYLMRGAMRGLVPDKIALFLERPEAEPNEKSDAKMITLAREILAAIENQTLPAERAKFLNLDELAQFCTDFINKPVRGTGKFLRASMFLLSGGRY